MIHVSDLIHYNRCHKYCWTSVHNRKPYESFYHMDKPFHELWMEYLNVSSYGVGQIGDSNETTLKLLNEYDVVCFSRFEYKECRTRIPVLIKLEKGYKAIYPYLSAYPKETEATIMKINMQIAKSCGVDIVEHEIIYLNKDYVRQDTLELDKLLQRSDMLFNRRNRQSKTIDECIENASFDLDSWIEEVSDVLSGDVPETKRTKKCTSSRKCIYYEDCFDETSQPDDSILFLTTSAHKLEEYDKGIRRICELDLEKFDGFKLQYAQYMASKNGIFYDKAALSVWMKKIKYPISYLDFEWDTFAIPPYKNMKPFDVLCFQYSLHIEDEKRNLIHCDFFKTNDCREFFIKSLINDLPKEGSILVYNMEGAEKLRLKQLAVQFPKYKDELNAICERMIDLSKPFECGIFYANSMRGHYSLKAILPAFTDEYSYKQLSIQNGLNAVFTYRTFDTSDIESQKKIREELRNYCKMDTFAEYVVFHGLEKYIKEDQNA